MFRQISFGAAAVLTAGLVAVGCGKDGDTVITGGSNDLNNPSDNFGATSIQSGNLAPDRGGLSPDDADVSGFRVIYNENLGGSDGVSNANCEAVILFTTSQGQTFVTHFNGSGITAPVELEATDHDQAQAFDINAAVVSFLNTSGYENSAATSDVVNNVRRNNGQIVLVMSGQTQFRNPTLNITRTGGANAGVHTGLWTWTFVPNFRGTEQLFASATSNPVGAVTSTTSRYYVSPTNEFRFGWQVNAGGEIALKVATGVIPAVSGAVDDLGTLGAATANDSPRADTLSFGLITDGNQRQSTFNGPNPPIDRFFAGRAQVFPSPGNIATAVTPRLSTFAPGEAVSVLGLVYTQVVTSLDQGGTNTNLNFGGSTVAAFASPFNLQTLEFETISRILPPGGAGSRNISYRADFASYNNIFVLGYNESTPQFNLTSFDPYGQATGNSGGENLFHKAGFRQNANGSAVVASNQDLSTRSSSTGVRRSFDPAATVAQENENQLGLGGSGSVVTIFGSDGTLAENLVLFTTTDATRGGGQEDTGNNVGNTDRAIYAALLTVSDFTASGGTGVTDGDLVVTTNNPLLVSRHDADDGNTVGEFEDNVQGASAIINRAGTYIAIAYGQAEGSSTATTYTFRRTLRTVIYQTVRFAGTSLAFASRFSAPFEVSDPTSGAGTSTGLANGLGITNNETHLPVNAYEFQNFIGYRIGFQSNDNVFWLTWEQSSTTEDRLFARAIAVTLPTAGTPTIASTNVTVEIDEQSTEQVQTSGVDQDGNGTNDRFQVNFIEGGLNNGTSAAGRTGGPDTTDSTTTAAAGTVSAGINAVQSCDLGTAGAQTGASTGGLFLVYLKRSDNTQPALVGNTLTGDSDGTDSSIFANSILVGGTADQGRTQIDNNFDENDITTLNSTGLDIFQVRPVATNPVITSTVQPNLIYVFFSEPTQAGAGTGTSDGVYCRVFDNSAFRSGQSTGSATDFNGNFVPSAATGSFAAPARLDNLTGGDVSGLVTGDPVVFRGNAAAIIWQQDGHDWTNGSADGRTFLTSGGAPAPVLVDQDRSSDVNANGQSQFQSCENGNGDHANGIYLASKKDVDGDARLVGRYAKSSVP